MFLDKAQCTGEVRLLGAHIGGQLDCTEASFTNPAARPWTPTGWSSTATCSCGKAQCTGEVRLTRRPHQRPAGLHRGQLHQPRGPGSRPGAGDRGGGRVHAPGRRWRAGSTSLTLESAAWHDEQKTWPQADACGWRGLSTTHRCPGRHRQGPAAVLAAPSTAICPSPTSSWPGCTGGRATSRPPAPWRSASSEPAEPTSRLAPWPSRAWSAVLRWTIGYGYRPVLALIPLAVLVLAGSVLFAVACSPASCARPRPVPSSRLQPFRYTDGSAVAGGELQAARRLHRRGLGGVGVVRVHLQVSQVPVEPPRVEQQ